MKQFFLLICCLYLIVPSSIGQINELKDGVLIVRLKSNNRKINALQESIAKNPNANPNLKSQLDAALIETKEVGEAMMEAFANEYSFSEVVFMHDTATVALRNGMRKGLFLNEKLEIIPTKSIEGRFFCLLGIGNSASGAEGFKVLDENLELLAAPFPYFVHVNNLSYLMNTLFGSETLARKRLYTRLAKKLQKNFDIHYVRQQG